MSPVRLAMTSSLLGAALLAACSGSARPGSADLRITPDGGTPILGDAGVLADAGAGAPTDAGPPLGAITIVDEPDAPCVPRGGSSVVLGATGVIAKLRRVGARRVAGDADGFLLFDDTGANAGTMKTSVGTYATAFATSPGAIGAVGTSFDQIEYRRYDPAGSAVGAPLVLQTGTADVPGLVLASTTTASLALWGDGRLYGAGVVSGGTVATPPFPIGGPFHSLLSDAITTSGDQFALVWTTQGAAAVQTWFALASTSGVVFGPTLVTSSASASVHRVVRIATTPTGFAVAIDTTAGSFVLPLTPFGAVAGAAHRYRGVRFTWDLASHGTGLGVASATADGHARFRPLDASGAPAGSWVCLESRATDQVALDDDDLGYAAVLHTMPDGQTTYLRFDALGTGP